MQAFSLRLPTLYRFIVQLDIFDHSQDVMLRNDVLAALQRFDVAAARVAWQRLAQAYPSDEALAASTLLIDALEQRSDAPFGNHDAARETVDTLAQTIEPVARRLFGHGDAADWMQPLWRLAAQRAAALPYRASHSEEHSAALLLRAHDWHAAAESAAAIESWRRIPIPLSWTVQARLRLEGLDAAWPLLVELAWLAPARLGQLWPALADPLLDKLRKQFEGEFEGRGDSDDLAWFPAWLLTQKSSLARMLGAAQPSGDREPERAMRLLVECIGLERQGRQHDLVVYRRRLRDLHPGLYDSYMKVR